MATSSLPHLAVVGEEPGPDPAHELQRREDQVDTAEDHMQSRDEREIQETRVAWLPEVVRGGRRDANERQGADRRCKGPTWDFSRHPILLSSDPPPGSPGRVLDDGSRDTYA